MDTLVTIELVTALSRERCSEHVGRAFGWFREVESCCSRFDGRSELMALCGTVDVPVEVSPLLFRAIEFSLAVARETEGAFDPTIGGAMAARGFDRNYMTGGRVSGQGRSSTVCSFRDVVLDTARHTVTLRRRLTLDLGAVAKGFAIDLAAAELRDFDAFAVYAGGDMYLRGRNPEGERWRVGIRHPRRPGAIIDTLLVSDVAVCTSGDYERRTPDGGTEHHIIDPRTGRSAGAAASVTTIAPSAMLADALGTAAFALGPARGLELLEHHGVEGMLISPALERRETRGFAGYRL